MKPNILIISIDSLSYQRFSAQLKTAKTPNIDKLGKNGTIFHQAISSADGTELSWISLLASQYPLQKKLSSRLLTKFEFDKKTHFHSLKNFDYHIYGTIPANGILFSLEDDFENNDAAYTSEFRIYDGLGDKIFKDFDNKLHSPWVYFIHLLDLHLPHFIPKQFNDVSFGDNPYDKMLSALDVWIGKLLEKINLQNTIVIVTADHGEFVPSIKINGKTISYFGKESVSKALWRIEGNIPRILVPARNKIFSLGRKLIKQKKSSLVKNLDLSEHQKRSLLFSRNDEMGYLYDDLVHIPLIFSGYKIPQKEIFEQVRHTDVFPTLFELADLPMTLENIQGRSLVPLLEDKSIEEQPVYMEGRFRIGKDESLSVIGIRTSTYKYFRGRKKTSNNVFLFNLKNDPLEEINLANKNPEIIEEMEKTLISINENNFNQIKTTKLTEDEKNKVELELRRLGYI